MSERILERRFATREDEKGSLEQIWRQLVEVDEKIYPNIREAYELLRDKGWNGEDKKSGQLLEFENYSDEEVAEGAVDWFRQIRPQLKEWYDFLLSAQAMIRMSDKARFLDHDTGSVATVPQANLCTIIRRIADGKNADIGVKDIKKSVCSLSYLISFWPRYRVSLEDIILRIVSADSVPDKCQKGLRLGTVKGVMDYFSAKELAKIQSDAAFPQSPYFGADKIKFEFDVDFKVLEDKIGGGAIKGNEGLILNFVLNELRNSFKNRIDAKNVGLSFGMSGGQFVIRIMNDGEAMKKEFLDPNSDDFIFKEGSTGTGSSGLGLTNFEKRIQSVGGTIRVISGGSGAQTNAYATEGAPRIDLNLLNSEREENNKKAMNTVFEIRLPITRH